MNIISIYDNIYIFQNYQITLKDIIFVQLFKNIAHWNFHVTVLMCFHSYYRVIYHVIVLFLHVHHLSHPFMFLHFIFSLFCMFFFLHVCVLISMHSFGLKKGFKLWNTVFVPKSFNQDGHFQ